MSSISTTPALLSVSELRLAFGLQPLLDGATLSVLPGEKVGLVGRNGSGKTSLFRMMAGDAAADSGGS